MRSSNLNQKYKREPYFDSEKDALVPFVWTNTALGERDAFQFSGQYNMKAKNNCVPAWSVNLDYVFPTDFTKEHTLSGRFIRYNKSTQLQCLCKAFDPSKILAIF